MEKKLYRKINNKYLCGVCAGLSEYFRIDVSIVRLAWIVFCCTGGLGVLAYIIAAIVIPEEPSEPPFTEV